MERYDTERYDTETYDIKTYDLKIFPSAQNDMREIVGYTNTLSPEAAMRYYDLILEKVRSLTTMPARRPFVMDTQLRLRGYRTLPVNNYVIFYIISGKTVEIRRVLYARRQYEGLYTHKP